MEFAQTVLCIVSVFRWNLPLLLDSTCINWCGSIHNQGWKQASPEISKKGQANCFLELPMCIDYTEPSRNDMLKLDVIDFSYTNF